MRQVWAGLLSACGASGNCPSACPGHPSVPQAPNRHLGKQCSSFSSRPEAAVYKVCSTVPMTLEPGETFRPANRTIYLDHESTESVMRISGDGQPQHPHEDS